MQKLKKIIIFKLINIIMRSICTYIKAFVQVYVLLGGVPRTGTFLKLHVVKTKNEAN